MQYEASLNIFMGDIYSYISYTPSLPPCKFCYIKYHEKKIH